jgi:glucose-6-phosphate isomerase
MGLIFNYENTNISNREISKYINQIKIESINIKNAIGNYNDTRASINLVYTKNNLKESRKVVSKFKDYSKLIVIGIGGSNLGCMAIYDSLKGQYSKKNDKKIFYVDTVDSFDIKQLIEKINQSNEKTLINIISKSGGTSETIANYFILKKNLVGKNIKYIITSDNDSKLDKFAKKNSIDFLRIDKNVGGRYSVFSNVGLFPLLFMGINCNKLLLGAKNALENSNSFKFKKDPAIQLAIRNYIQFKRNRSIVNYFFFNKRFENIGKWQRQLLAESLGKEWNFEHSKKVKTGILPIISIGSTDLHSMGQLYLGGPNNIYHEFINLNDNINLKLDKNKDMDNLVENLSNKNLNDLKNAILKGTKDAFKKKKIPFTEINFEKGNEEEIGEYLQIRMLQTMYLGHLMKVNPFTQENVEDYKKITKELLKY